MFKKTALIITMLALAAAGVFAADTYESGTLYYTNSFIDDSDEYVATVREAELELMNGSGGTIDSQSATAYYTIKNNGTRIERAVAGDSQVFEILDQIYDGYVMTPYNDAVMSYDDSQLEDAVVDGVDCLVYQYEVAIDKSAFQTGSRQSGLIGWDADEEDENGDLVMTVAISKEDGSIVKSETVYKTSSLTYTMSADFTLVEADGALINVPATVTTEGRINSAGTGAVSDTVNFRTVETFSGYQEADGYHD